MRHLIVILALLPGAALAEEARLRLMTDGRPLPGLPVVVEDGSNSTVVISDGEGLVYLPADLSASAEIVIPTGGADKSTLRHGIRSLYDGTAAVSAFGAAATGRAAEGGIEIEVVE